MISEIHSRNETLQLKCQMKYIFISFHYSEGDVADYIMLHLLDQTKSRRQIVREMVHLDLIGSAKELKKMKVGGNSRRWREEEEMELRDLYGQHKESQGKILIIHDKLYIYCANFQNGFMSVTS